MQQSGGLTDQDWFSYLTYNNIIENYEETIKREKVLSLLQTILPNFQRRVVQSQDYKRGDLDCLLSPFGSYALGGYIRNADIDVVLVCPGPVSRSDFFKFFPELLRQQPTIRDVDAIQRTTVPIIKCTIDSISIDISFVRLRGSKLPENLSFLDDSILDDIDARCLASMDGPRVNKFIKNHIAKQHLTLFQHCLQCIKHWASERDIYNKPTGYLNGGSWTLLLLKTYMTESAKAQDLTITHILREFFETWSNWPWPTPVLLTDFIPGKDGEHLSFHSLSELATSVMPIVSPCYPVCSVAPFVTKSTLKIMTREFQRASVILSTQTDPRNILTKLFNSINYFKRYNDFICITTSSLTTKSHDIWTRKTQHNMPELLSLLEANPKLKQIQVMVKPVIISKQYRTLQERHALQNEFTGEDARSLELTGELHPGIINIIYQFIGIKLVDSCKVLGKSVDLSEEIKLFLAVLESRRNRHDEDVKWAITAMKKTKVAELMGIDTTN